MIKIDGKPAKIEKFPNGEVKIISDKYPTYIDLEINLELIFESNNDLIELYFIKKHLDSIKNCTVNLQMKYVPYSRMDRVKDSNFVFTLKHFCDFINDLNFNSVIIYEPHSDVTSALLNNVNIISPLEDIFEYVKFQLNFDPEIDYIYYPDFTAKKRQEDNFKYKNILYGLKHRDFNTGEITGLEIQGDTSNIVKGKSKVVMIDDLTSYGGTFVFGDKKLKELGFDKSYLITAHTEKAAFEKELFNHIEKLYTTNSIIQTEDVPENLKNRVVLFT